MQGNGARLRLRLCFPRLRPRSPALDIGGTPRRRVPVFCSAINSNRLRYER